MSRTAPVPGQPEPGDAAALRLREAGTALSEVLDGLALIDGGNLDDDARRQLLRARAAGRAAARLIAPSPPDDGGPLDLLDVLHDLEDRWGGQAVARGTGFSLVIAPDAPRWLSIDRGLLDRLLSALLGAALAEANTGPIRLEAVPAAADLVLTVTAEGVAAAGRDSIAGSPHAIADLLGGRLEIGRTDDDTPRATLRLPPDSWAGTAPGIPDRALEGLRILLSAPGTTEALILSEIVGRHGGKVVAADDGSSPAPVQVIDADAADAAEQLRQARTNGRGPVLALTSVLSALRRDELAEAGADGLLARPLPAPDTLVRILLEARRGSGADADGFDPSRLERLLDLAGTDVAGELLDRLVEDLAAVETGLAAAAPARDITGLRAQTHVLISLAGAVGAERLQHLAEALNAAAHAADAAAIDRIWTEAAPLLDKLQAHVAGVREGRGTGG